MTNHPNLIMKLHQADVREVEEWRELDATIKKLTGEVAGIQERFTLAKKQMGAQLATFKSVPLVTMRTWNRMVLDTDRLKRERPEIYSEYRRESSGEKAKYVEL